MFAIYTPNGRTFSGPLEELRRVDKTQRLKATREHHETDDILTFGQKDYAVAPKAVEAYIESINLPNHKEQVHHAYQVMTSPVQVLDANCSIATAIEKFEQFPFQAFPIINNKYRLVGCLSRQSLYEYILKNNDSETNKVKTVTQVFLHENTKAYVADPVTDVRRIAALMMDHQLHIVPIIESSGCIVGILSRTNIIKAVVTDPPISLWC